MYCNKEIELWPALQYVVKLFEIYALQFSSVQSLSRVQLFATPWTIAHQASLSITNSRSSLKLMSIESVMPSNHLIILGTYLPGEFVICCPVFLPFHTVQGFSRQEH